MNRIIYVLLFAVALFLLTMYDLYTAFLLAMIWIAVPILTWAMAFLSRKSMKCAVSCPLCGRKGETMDIALSLTGPFVPFLSSVTAYLGGQEYDAYEQKGKEIRFLFQKELLHCGRVPMDSLTVVWKDPFGLFHFHITTPGSIILVLPSRIGKTPLIVKRLLSIAGSDEVEYFGATEYKPGDNPHLINWKITARRDDVYVRDSMPADNVKITLAADYTNREEVMDTIGDALYSTGWALASSHMTFRFAWATKDGLPVVTTIHTPSEWQDAILSFLRQGGDHGLAKSPLSPLVPICYITGNPNPSVSPSLHPTIWCALEGANRAALSGRRAIFHALGGTAT